MGLQLELPPAEETATLNQMNRPSMLELCAGAGGQALGYDQAGFEHTGLVEIDKHACATLRLNRPEWNVLQRDLTGFGGSGFKGVDLIAAGLPCPPFSVAAKQLGTNDERNLFPPTIRLVDEIRPRAVMIENVRGLLDAVFKDYRGYVAKELAKLGYETAWKLMNASDFGVPQLRPRVIFIAVRKDLTEHFSWPQPSDVPPKTVGETLYDLMASNGWRGAKSWARQADEIAPTIVGGSHKHGGPDLGPTRARKAWATLGVDGLGIANEIPPRDFVGMPRLTVRMVARIQGFPDDWQFAGGKTHNDRSDLKPGQYLLVNPKPIPAFERGISKETRSEVLDRNGFTCQMCGAVAGESHPSDPTRRTRLHIGHTVDKSMDGSDEPSNLRAICSVCNEGARNLTPDRPSLRKLLIQVRRATGADQVGVFRWLIRKFPKQGAGILAESIKE